MDSRLEALAAMLPESALLPLREEFQDLVRTSEACKQELLQQQAEVQELWQCTLELRASFHRQRLEMMQFQHSLDLVAKQPRRGSLEDHPCKEPVLAKKGDEEPILPPLSSLFLAPPPAEGFDCFRPPKGCDERIGFPALTPTTPATFAR